METTARFVRAGVFTTVKRDPVKLTALVYLREALLKEKYEECAEIIAVAEEFGAKDFEINVILEDPRRQPRG